MNGLFRGFLAGIFAVATALASGCITSPTGAHGATAEAKAAALGSCPQGVLDDGEDGNGQVKKQENRDGYWFTIADPDGSTITPKGEFTMSEGGRPGSRFAARMHGRIAERGESLYAGMGLAFTNPKTPYDASKYKGVRFWAKGPARVRLKLPDVNTAPEGDRCSDCYNDFGVDLYLSESWERYTVPFDELNQQPGWGDPAPAVASNGIFAVQWQFSNPGAAYDVWIDDVELVGCE
jgi:endoglucanase